MTYPVASTPAVFVDHQALAEMLDSVKASGTRALLLGFGEYAKHLVNLAGDNVAAIMDPDPFLVGMSYKGKHVIGIEADFDANLIIVCEYRLAYEYIGRLAASHPNVRRCIPTQISGKSTLEIDVFEQEAFYHELFRKEARAPISMMNRNKLKLLIELFRLGLTFEGDVVEMGCWQGGSTWYLARALALLGEDRQLFALDLFETHMSDPTATMCTDEVTRKLLRENPNCHVLVGLVDDPDSLARIPGPICFAHIDLGPVPDALEFVWERLSPGAPLVLDNYGHIQAPTWQFDWFFRDKGTRVIRLPWSEQGLVFKTAD